MATTSTGPRTISDVLGIGPLLLMLLLATAALAIVVDNRDPQRLACQEDEVITGTGDFNGDTAGWDGYACTNVDELVTVPDGEPVHYCAGSAHILVFEGGKKAGGGAPGECDGQ